MTHPYRDLPDRAFWSRAVSRGFDPAAVVGAPEPLLRAGDRVASMGSCFAANLVPWIERAGFAYVRTEQPPPVVAHLPEHLGYRRFSAAYGNIYTSRQMLQLVRRCLGEFRPAEDRWLTPDAVLDPFRPGLAYPAATEAEFDVLTAAHLEATAQAVREADVLVVTLGLTEAWESTADGAVFPTCPGTVAGEFDPARHRFRNLGPGDVEADLRGLVAALRRINPALRLVLTVSPVPLVATATDSHVLAATVWSKSVLRVAAGAVEAAGTGVAYFPAYEVVTGPQAPGDFFEPDRRSVSPRAVAAVMAALLAHCETAGGGTGASAGVPPAAPPPEAAAGAAAPAGIYPAMTVARRIAEAECDEALLDPGPAAAAGAPAGLRAGAPGTAAAGEPAAGARAGGPAGADVAAGGPAAGGLAAHPGLATPTVAGVPATGAGIPAVPGTPEGGGAPGEPVALVVLAGTDPAGLARTVVEADATMAGVDYRLVLLVPDRAAVAEVLDGVSGDSLTVLDVPAADGPDAWVPGLEAAGTGHRFCLRAGEPVDWDAVAAALVAGSAAGEPLLVTARPDG